jgi:hypothetical protein
MKALSIALVAITAPLVTATPSSAGTVANYGVTVDPSGMSAYASMGYAYTQFKNVDGTQYIACVSVVDGSGSGMQADVFCVATDAATPNPNSGSCAIIGMTPGLFAQVMGAFTQDALIQFMWDSGGYCTYLVAEPGSFAPPKQ